MREKGAKKDEGVKGGEDARTADGSVTAGKAHKPPRPESRPEATSFLRRTTLPVEKPQKAKRSYKPDGGWACFSCGEQGHLSKARVRARARARAGARVRVRARARVRARVRVRLREQVAVTPL